MGKGVTEHGQSLLGRRAPTLAALPAEGTGAGLAGDAQCGLQAFGITSTWGLAQNANWVQLVL